MTASKSILIRTLQAFREHGLLGMVRQYIRTRSPLHHCVIYCVDSPVEEKRIADLTITRYPSLDQMGDDHLKQLAGKNPDTGIRGLQDLFNIGAELWVGDIAGRVAVVCWSRSHRLTGDYFVPLEPSDSTIFSCYTVADFRGRGLYPAMLKHMINTLIAQGQKRILIDCKTWNTPSIRGIEKAGFKSLGTSWRIVYRGRVWHFLNRCRRPP